jgi:hypothetical protein
MPLPAVSADMPFSAFPTLIFNATGDMLVFNNESEPEYPEEGEIK